MGDLRPIPWLMRTPGSVIRESEVIRAPTPVARGWLTHDRLEDSALARLETARDLDNVLGMRTTEKCCRPGARPTIRVEVRDDD
jgi:hypothetical protein